MRDTLTAAAGKRALNVMSWKVRLLGLASEESSHVARLMVVPRQISSSLE